MPFATRVMPCPHKFGEHTSLSQRLRESWANGCNRSSVHTGAICMYTASHNFEQKQPAPPHPLEYCAASMIRRLDRYDYRSDAPSSCFVIVSNTNSTYLGALRPISGARPSRAGRERSSDEQVVLQQDVAKGEALRGAIEIRGLHEVLRLHRNEQDATRGTRRDALFPTWCCRFCCCEFYGFRLLRISSKFAALVGTVVDFETMKRRVDTGVPLHFSW